MIRKLILNKIGCFKSAATLETDRKINLIYGLNGTGKSTISNYFHSPSDQKYKDCSILGLTDTHEVLVYNQAFIQDTFFESESLPGIFTLSKENKEAESKISLARKEIIKQESEKELKIDELEKEKKEADSRCNTVREEIWKLKTDYSGGDRVLEFCLDGLKHSKDVLFAYLLKLPKPEVKPDKTISDLKEELSSISGDNAIKYEQLSMIEFSAKHIEVESLLRKEIVGNENSTVSSLIKNLGNSDWVKAGLEYLPTQLIKESAPCPFCQEKTITTGLIESIKEYFDASYEADVNHLRDFLVNYSNAIRAIPSVSTFESNPKFGEFKNDFAIKYNYFLKVVEENENILRTKLQTP